MLLFYRIADGNYAVWTESFLDAKKLAYIILGLRAVRLRLEARTSVAMYPAAAQIHGSDSQLDECS